MEVKRFDAFWDKEYKFTNTSALPKGVEIKLIN